MNGTNDSEANAPSRNSHVSHESHDSRHSASHRMLLNGHDVQRINRNHI